MSTAKDRIVTVTSVIRCTQQELAANLELSPATVEQYVAQLQREGRIVADPHPLNHTRSVYRAADAADDRDHA